MDFEMHMEAFSNKMTQISYLIFLSFYLLNLDFENLGKKRIIKRKVITIKREKYVLLSYRNLIEKRHIEEDEKVK